MISEADMQWMLERYPDAATRKMVMQQYLDLSRAELVLADIAMRGKVYETTHKPDAIESAFQEGRRAMALEILRLAEMMPASLKKRILNT